MENRGARVDKWHEKKSRYLARLASHGVAATLGERRGARWARTAHGVVGILGASDAGDRWWFGLNEREFHANRAIGLILLCEAGDVVMDFGLAADKVQTILPKLGADRRGEKKLNVVSRGERYALQIPNGDPIDLTSALHDLAWLAAAEPAPSVANASPVAPRSAESPAPDSQRFFAKIQRGTLRPLDRVALKEGEIVLLEMTRVSAVPSHASLRSIVAAGGTSALPADFAIQHDFYARGARRR